MILFQRIIKILDTGEVRFVVTNESSITDFFLSHQIIKARSSTSNSRADRLVYLNEKAHTATIFVVVTAADKVTSGESSALLTLTLPIPDYLWPSESASSETTSGTLFSQASISVFVVGVLIGVCALVLFILIAGLFWFGFYH